MNNTSQYPIGILLFTTSLKSGGTEKEVLLLCTKINKTKFAPVVVSLNGKGPIAKNLKMISIPVVDLGFTGFFKVHSFLKIVRRIIKIVSLYKIKIIHAYSFGPTIFGVVVTLLTRSFFISSQRNLHMWSSKRYLWTYKLVLRAADCILCNSKAGRNLILGKIPSLKKKLKVIYNLIEIPDEDIKIRQHIRDKLKIENDELVVGTVANFRTVKNPTMFVDIGLEVCNMSDGLIFISIGDGPERQLLESRVAEAGMNQKIQFLGQVVPANPYYEAMDIFILTSNNEGCPMVVLEAMSHGLPVVATHVGGVPEIVQKDVNGILVSPNDTSTFVESLYGLIKDVELQQRMGKKSRQIFYKHFKSTEIISQLENVYCELYESIS